MDYVDCHYCGMEIPVPEDHSYRYIESEPDPSLIRLKDLSAQDLIAEILRRGDSRIRAKQLGLMTRLGITISGKPWVAQESGPFTVIVIRD